MKAIDLFAGAGGFSTGAVMAGVDVVWAANHWQSAVDTHALNHPDTEHACEDMHRIDWMMVPNHDVLLASPCCQGHSKARGQANGNPQHDTSRATAWAVIDALECHCTQAAVVENVPEFLDWVLYPAWRAALEALGYSLAPHIVDAADHGVPQHRERMFLVLTRSKSPIVLDLPKRPHVPASSFIDFEAGRWSTVEGHVPATLRRVAAGRRSFGDRFIMPYYGNGSGLTGRCLSRPIGAITTRDRWALVRGEHMRMLSIPEAKAAMSFPAETQLPKQSKLAMHMLGNAVAPLVARDVITALRRAA